MNRMHRVFTACLLSGTALAGAALADTDQGIPLITACTVPHIVKTSPPTYTMLREVFYSTPDVQTDAVTKTVSPIGSPVDYHADVYTPFVPSANPARAIIYAHGGGWTGAGNADTIQFWTNQLTGVAGTVVVNFEYPLVVTSTKTNYFPAAQQAASCAVRYVKANAARFNIDPNQIFLLGSSAGAQIAGVAAVTDDQPVNFIYDNADCGFNATDRLVKGATLEYGFPKLDDIAFQSSSSLPAHLLGCTPGTPACDSQVHLASVYYLLHPGMPWIIQTHGSSDTISKVQPIIDTANALLAYTDVPSAYIEVTGPGHEFDLISYAPQYQTEMCTILGMFAAP